MAVTDFKAESFLFMVLEVLSPDRNYFEMRFISATFGDKGISIYPGKIIAKGPLTANFLKCLSPRNSCYPDFHEITGSQKKKTSKRDGYHERSSFI